MSQTGASLLSQYGDQHCYHSQLPQTASSPSVASAAVLGLRAPHLPCPSVLHTPYWIPALRGVLACADSIACAEAVLAADPSNQNALLHEMHIYCAVGSHIKLVRSSHFTDAQTSGFVLQLFICLSA